VRRIDAFHWGLVPVWAKDPKVGSRMINARAESVASKNAFRPALESRRCLIPADGFYEWQAVAGRAKKQPMFIHSVDGTPLAFAGLRERWWDRANPDAGTLHTCAVITTSANAQMVPIHDRMPVILPPVAWTTWLGDEADLDELQALLVPAEVGLLAIHPVSADVGNVRNNDAHLVEPIDLDAIADPDQIPGQGSLL
jgi:putative SOS response-associated peptidase YedK